MSNYLVQFVSDSFCGDAEDEGFVLLDSFLGGFFVFEMEPVFEPDGSKHSEVVFLDSLVGVTDESKQSSFEVGDAVYVVVKLFCDGVVKNAVDGEVSSVCIFFSISECDVFWSAAIRVSCVGSEGGDFEVVVVFVNKDDSEVFSDGIGFFEKVFDGFWFGVGGNVEVFGIFFEKKISYAASGEEGLVAVVLEFFYDGDGGLLHRFILAWFLGLRKVKWGGIR